MKFIAISFTLKGQSFDDIKLVLERISLQTGATAGKAVLVHGFMPREVVIEKGFSTDVVDTLKALFPFQLNCYKDAPDREMMAEAIKQNKGTVYVVGDIKEGVAEEVALYEQATRYITKLPLGWDGTSNGTNPLPTKGEYRVRVSFNVSGASNVDKIKNDTAALIDFCEEGATATKVMDNKNDNWKNERCRLFSLAQTAYEEAAMWAVKAETI